MKKYFKKVNWENEKYIAIDYNKINELDFTLFFLISERGRVCKSFGAKDFMLEQYKKYNKLSGYILNIEKQWDEAGREFLDKNREKYPEKWKDVEIKRDGLYLNNVRFCRFMTLNSAERYKSNRRELDYLFWDEMNVCMRVVRKSYVRNFYSIIGSSSNPGTGDSPKCFILSNQATLDNPIYEKLEIFDMETELLHNEKAGYYLYVPSTTDRETIQWNQYNKRQKQWFNVAKLLGVYDTDIANKNSIDCNWGVLKKSDELKNGKWEKDKHIIKTENRYYEVYTRYNTNKEIEWYLVNIERPKTSQDNILYCKYKDAEFGAQKKDFLREEMRQLLMKSLLFVDSISTKYDLLDMLK